MRRLQHHHIPKVHDVYRQVHRKREETHDLIIEPLADGTLRGVLRRPLTSTERKKLQEAFCCLAVTVEYLHSRAQMVRHKDIKPENILMHGGSVFLTDFGIAHDSLEQQRMTTDNPHPLGTVFYWAPEYEARPNQPRNEKSDIFSLGCVYLELMNKIYSAGLTLPETTRRSWYHSIEHLQAQLVDYERRVKSVSQKGLAALFRRLISRDPAQRPTAEELVRELKRIGGESYFCSECLPEESDEESDEEEEDEEEDDDSGSEEDSPAYTAGTDPNAWRANLVRDSRYAQLVAKHRGNMNAVRSDPQLLALAKRFQQLQTTRRA